MAAAENFPFCTIEPNIVKVGVPDKRLDSLAATCGAAKVVPGMLEIRDIAGIIKGASAGAGMGNEFLSQIRGVQVVLHVVRCFSNPDIIHVEDPVNIDPIKEYESILEELIIADLEYASRRVPALKRKALTSDSAGKLLPIYEAVLKCLEEGRAARTAVPSAQELFSITGSHGNDEFLAQLITAKPVVVLANVMPEDAAQGNAYAERLLAHVAQSEASQGTSTAARRGVVVSAPLEAEVSALDDEDFRKEYIQSYGLDSTERALAKVLAESQSMLGLISYLTVGEQEARAWFVNKGTKANEAAGVIHTDFVKGFEAAELWTVDDILRLGGKSACRKAGLVKQKGKDYEVQDGDVIEFKIRKGRS